MDLDDMKCCISLFFSMIISCALSLKVDMSKYPTLENFLDDLDRDDHKVALLSPADRRVQEVDLSPPSLHERDYQKSSNSSTISLPATVLITTSYFLGDLHGIAAPTPEPQLSTSTTSP